MEKRTIKLSELDLGITYSKKDDSPRGICTVYGSKLKVGDLIVIDDHFHEIINEETTTEKIIEYFEKNEGVFNECIEELDNYNGYLNDDRYYSMDELDEFYNSTKPLEILCRAYYGRDDDTWTTDEHGEKHYGEFNPNRDYFYYNGYGNLVSSDYKDYSHKLDTYVVEEMSENRKYIDTIEEYNELSALFDELETEE